MQENKGAQTVRSPTEPLSATDYLLCANDKNSENIFTLKLFLLVMVRQKEILFDSQCTIVLMFTSQPTPWMKYQT